jgi:NADH-quinone oxidoreductase subunit H
MLDSAVQFLGAHPLVLATLKILIVFSVLSGVLAYIVYLERKVLAFMQARLGPMRVGPWGILQAIADPLKLILKEDIVPSEADRTLFLIAPVISVAAAFTVFAAIPFGDKDIVIHGVNLGLPLISNTNVGILFILAVSSLGIYGIILGGWASNSHYPLLGALRSAAQLVSYEVAGGMAIIGVLLISHSLSLVKIVEQQRDMRVWNVFLQPVGFFIYLVAAIAETNRSPFDLPEAESELTAGFHTEYSGFRFSLFFMAEYTSMVLVSCIAVTLFWGGWLRPFSSYHALDFLNFTPVAVFLTAGVAIVLGARKNRVPMEKLVLFAIAAAFVLLAITLTIPVVTSAISGIFWFSAKVFVFLYAFIWYRGTFPRYRYDQLMNLGWRVMIPLGLANVIVTAAVCYLMQSHPAPIAMGMLGR